MTKKALVWRVIAIVVVIVVALLWYWRENIKDQLSFDQFSDGFKFSYPTFLKKGAVSDKGTFVTMHGTYQGQDFDLVAHEIKAEQWEKDKASYIEQGWKEGASQPLRNNLQAATIVSDLNRDPAAGTKNCTYHYTYVIPDDTRHRLISFDYKVSQPGVGEDGNWDACIVYKQPYYGTSIKILHDIIASFELF